MTHPIHETGPVLFIADLHLDRQRPAMIERFQAFCAGPARRAQAVYILGDLFDVWVGDDDDTEHEPVITALSELTASGIPTRFMAGNRDFLIGPAFLDRTGLQPIPDPQVIELFGTRTLLCHGDTLCTDDVDYQRFRAQVRAPEWQRAFLKRPLAERRQLAQSLRGDSRDAMAAKETTIMDVNEPAVVESIQASGAERLIHGHTHQPAVHRHYVDGGVVERHVLGAWYERASLLVATADGLRSEPLDQAMLDAPRPPTHL